jgi:hypothetical protein
MSRASRRQLGIGQWIGEWPIAFYPGRAITLGDWRRCLRPEIGIVYLIVFPWPCAVEAPIARPRYAEMLLNGISVEIGKYASAAERRALLCGERIEHGEH